MFLFIPQTVFSCRGSGGFGREAVLVSHSRGGGCLLRLYVFSQSKWTSPSPLSHRIGVFEPESPKT